MGHPGEFRYASDLVAFIRRVPGDHFHIEVGCYPETHPQAEHALPDLKHFKAHVEAGAAGAITPYFSTAHAYFRFVAALRRLGVALPVVPGNMPITNLAQLPPLFA